MSENSIRYNSAGNLVSLTMNKSYNITSFSIDESLLLKDQKELLEEMISSSVNEAVSKVSELRKKLEEEDSDDNDNKEKFSRQPNLFNMNFNDMNQMFSDISKMTSVEYKDGKINISLDSITPDMITKMNDIMNNMNKNNDDDKNKE
ncbi:YbaB/EbfC family nucleoid-associated protein [Brachyspira sp.]|uniref:YbaB/EbfC family nucleoid-associated protein n=1 Tax=Brachyspira sp. TaxID=1977261 RepID=UPI00261B79AB|nr:YbaB/EbfC family nucleoid-associated protein [Brachyspira sp.]